MVKEYRCVDLLHAAKVTEIKASSPEIAMKRYFKMNGINEKPVRSKTQTHKRELDGRFYATLVDRKRNVLTCFNREGYEFNACNHFEFKEEDGKNLTWTECVEKLKN